MRDIAENRGSIFSGRSIGDYSERRSQLTDQIAVVWTGDNEIVTALPVPGRVPGDYEMDHVRLGAGLQFSEALRTRRERFAELPPVSERTAVSSVVPDFSERTRILALAGETLALDDDDLKEWLINAEEQMTTGTDSHPIFETALEDTACSVTRLPNGQVSMTEAPRPQVNAARQRIEMLLGEKERVIRNITLETPVRCVARYFVNAAPKGAGLLQPEKRFEITAFLLITRSGFSYGLWSPSHGLFSENAFLAPQEISGRKAARSVAGTAGISISDEPSTNDPAVLESYVRQVFDQFALELSAERLDQTGLAAYSQIVWTCEPALRRLVAEIAAEHSKQTGLDQIGIDIPADEAIAAGLLFGSFPFGDELMTDDVLPQINLARDLMATADKVDFERVNFEEMAARKRRAQSIFVVAAAPVMAFALLLGIVANNLRAHVFTYFRDAAAESRATELKPKLDLRRSYETNMKWYQEFITQVGRLRRQQPVGIGLQYELNSRYPLDIDPSFYVSELKLLPSGGVEIKGLAQSKDAVTTFLKSLESAGGTKSGTRLFSNLTYEVQEGPAPVLSGQTVLPTAAKTTLTANLAPGVVAWTVRGNYVPMAEFAPPSPTPTPGPNQPGPAGMNPNSATVQPGPANPTAR